MANHKSCKKRVRSDEKRRVAKRKYISSVRNAITTVKENATKGEDKDSVYKDFQKAQTLLAKAASHGYLHKNNAQRRISRLSLMIKKDPKELVAIAEASKKKKKKVLKRKTTKKK